MTDNDGFVYKITQQGQVSTFISGLTQVDGLAFDSNDNLYAADGGDQAIYKYDALGNQSVFVQNTSYVPFEGLALDAQGNVYEADAFTNNLEVFDPSGNHINSISLGYVAGGEMAFQPLASTSSVPEPGLLALLTGLGLGSLALRRRSR